MACIRSPGAKAGTVLGVIWLVFGCSGTESQNPPGSGGSSQIADTGGAGGDTGGAAAVGGNASTGGNTGVAPSAGGSVGTGGTNASAGGTTAASTGGSGTVGGSNTGGSKPTGGMTGAGGAATGGSRLTGGTTATGGTVAAGGTLATGGTRATGGTVSTGGSLATGGSKAATGGSNAATGGSTSTAGKCGFLSGLDVAWVSFAKDVPNPNIAAFNTVFTNTHAAGGRIIRWWFHTNGTTTPGYDSSGLAVKLPQSHIDGVKAILSAAASAGVGVNISLWSFDMLQANAGNTYVNNQALIENDTNRQAYIDNYLTPLVTALKGTPGLYSYEIFNEPEGMSQYGWATHRTTEAYIQKTVNWLAAAIHTADPTALVTNGAQTFDYCSTVTGKNQYYSDTALRNAGGKQNGTLDFYEVHYYTTNGTSNSPFRNAASHWGLDKKLVIGEFYAITQDGVNGSDTYTYLYTNGYSGAWAWQYEANDAASTANNNGATSTKWPAMQVPMQNLYNAHADVGNCP